MIRRMAVFTGLVWLIIVAATFVKTSEAIEKPFLLSFVVGDYVLVGQYPDSSLAYAGVARIEKTKDRLIMTRKIGAKTVKAEGVIEVPQPPGEGSVIRFRWVDQDAMVMTCLVNADLDNYARLTCYLVVEGRVHRQPGIEALFPTATWPKDAPCKTLQPAGKTGG